MKPVTVIEVLAVDFPVDFNDPASASLLQSRFLEVQQYQKRFKGCGSARSAASGIFNVKVNKPRQADASKLPPPIQAAFKKAGVGKAIGPFRAPDGLQVLALCSRKDIKPKMPEVQYPTREQVKTVLINERFNEIDKKYGTRFRNAVIVEYLDQSYAP